jgi:hypothetical protein
VVFGRVVRLGVENYGLFVLAAELIRQTRRSTIRLEADRLVAEGPVEDVVREYARRSG